MPFPRAGRICAAQILAELGDVRQPFPTADQPAAAAGVSPVTRAWGKSCGVVFRWAFNRRLRAAIRGRGCDHPHGIRILARAWIRVLWRAWGNHTLYDPALQNSATPYNQTLRA